MKDKLREFLIQELGEDFDKDIIKSPYSNKKFHSSRNISPILGEFYHKELSDYSDNTELLDIEPIEYELRNLDLSESPKLSRTAKYKKIEEDNEKEYNTLNNICSEISQDSLEGYLDNNFDNVEFKDTLLKFMKSKNMTDPSLYNKVGISRKVFNKIWNVSNYKPCKDTIILLGIGLELTLDPFNELLSSGEYALSKNIRDNIIKYFILNKLFDVNLINEGLYSYNQPILGECKK